MKKQLTLCMSIGVSFAVCAQQHTTADSLKKLKLENAMALRYVDSTRNIAMAQITQLNDLRGLFYSYRNMKVDSPHKVGLDKKILSAQKEMDAQESRFDSTLVLLDSSTGALNKLNGELEEFRKRHPVNGHP